MHVDNGNGDSGQNATYRISSADPLRGSNSGRLINNEHSGSKSGRWTNE
ncbi:hypothetical protein [Paenibacillus yonginensis]|nr:hypothetical protein [Paenibacillus yonginensis]